MPIAGRIAQQRTRKGRRATNYAWRAFVTEKYGAPPQVTYMDSPVIVDNTTRQIIVG